MLITNLDFQTSTTVYLSYHENGEYVQLRTTLTSDKNLSKDGFEISYGESWESFFSISDELYKTLNNEFLTKKENRPLMMYDLTIDEFATYIYLSFYDKEYNNIKLRSTLTPDNNLSKENFEFLSCCNIWESFKIPDELYDTLNNKFLA